MSGCAAKFTKHIACAFETHLDLTQVNETAMTFPNDSAGSLDGEPTCVRAQQGDVC